MFQNMPTWWLHCLSDIKSVEYISWRLTLHSWEDQNLSCKTKIYQISCPHLLNFGQNSQDTVNSTIFDINSYFSYRCRTIPLSLQDDTQVIYWLVNLHLHMSIRMDHPCHHPCHLLHPIDSNHIHHTSQSHRTGLRNHTQITIRTFSSFLISLNTSIDK